MPSNKKIFFISFALSISIHLLSLFGINYRPFWQKKGPLQDLFSTFEHEEKNLILEQAFTSSSATKKKIETKDPSPQKSPPLLLQSPHTIEPSLHLPLFLSVDLTPIASPDFTAAIFSLPLPSLSEPPHLLSPPPLFTSHEEKKSVIATKENHHVKLISGKLAIDPLPFTFTINALHPEISSTFTPSQAFQRLALPPPMPKFPSLADLSAVSYADVFDTEILFAPLEEEDGYFFAITLIPHPDVHLPNLSQHYDFLIDRSHSITWERLNITKHAILKAIEGLSVEDSFNIIAFDGKVEKLTSSSLAGIPTSVRKAKEFLESVQLGSFFSSANLAKPLIFTAPSNQDELRTAILLTDGEAIRKKGAQRELGIGWTSYNQGQVSLFCVGLENDPQIHTLSIVSSLNRGKLLHAPSERGIKRKLLKLMKMISHPVAKDLSIHSVSSCPDSEITLYPKEIHQIPHLYQHQPYVIFGTTKELEPFTLFIQGKLKNRYLNIKKKISFEDGKVAPSLLKSEWVLYRSYELYRHYLNDSDPSHLVQLHTLLDPLHLPVAFE